MIRVHLESVAFGGDALDLPEQPGVESMHDPMRSRLGDLDAMDNPLSGAFAEEDEMVTLSALEQRDGTVAFGDLITISRDDGRLLTAYARPTGAEPRDIPHLPAAPRIASRAVANAEPRVAWTSSASLLNDQTTFAWRVVPAVTDAPVTAARGLPVRVGDRISLQFQLAPRMWAYLDTETRTLVTDPMTRSLDVFVLEVK